VRASTASRAVRLTAVIAIVLWSLGPVALGLVTSISSQKDAVATPPHWIPKEPTLDAYRSLLEGTSTHHAGGTVVQPGQFTQAMIVSTQVAIITTLVVLVVATMAAYAFGRLRFRFGSAVFAVIISTIVVPVFVVVVALFKLMADAGLIDTKKGLVLVFLATITPLATWLLYNQVRDLPKEPEESALIDGCRRIGAFVRIVVPQMMSGIAAVAAIVLLTVWGEFLIPLLLASTENAKPVTVLITEYVGKYTTNYPILAAAGVLALIPPAIIALVLNRRITGMLSGSS
jgi:multiple sugar transport system permease protein